MYIAMLVKNSFEYDARVRREATRLARAGHRVRVVALAAGDLPRSEEHPGGFEVVRVRGVYGRLARVGGPSTATPGVGGSVGRLSRIVRSRTLAPVRFVARLLNTVVVDRRMRRAAGRPDVVHAHDLNTLLSGHRLAQGVGAALVYDSHELHGHRAGAGWWRRRTSRWLEARLCADVDAIVTATRTWAAMLGEAFGVEDVVVLRNVPELADPTPVDVRAATGLARDCAVLMYQGSIQAGRGIEEGMLALSRLPDVGLVVVGYGAHRPVLERRAAALGVDDRVVFTGPVPNERLVDWTAGADVSLCLIQDVGLSYRTSLPNKLFESLMAGTPIVVSDFGEMGEVVRRTGAGRAVPPDDAGAIADAVRELLDPTVHASCSGAGRRAARSELNWEHEARGLDQLYARLEARRAEDS